MDSNLVGTVGPFAKGYTLNFIKIIVNHNNKVKDYHRPILPGRGKIIFVIKIMQLAYQLN